MDMDIWRVAKRVRRNKTIRFLITLDLEGERMGQLYEYVKLGHVNRANLL